MRRFLQLIIFVVCLSFSVAAAYNVFSDNAEVQRMAGLVACADEAGPTGARERGGDAVCKPHMTRLERTPFGQTFEFVTTARRTVGVRCVRAYFFAGGYACKVQ